MAQEYIRPAVEEIGSQLGSLGLLRADTEQQQQQQQQQQRAATVRRFLDETSLPQEEIVTKLTTEIKTINKLAARAK